MIVYVYNKETNEKRVTLKGVTQVVSATNVFHVYQGEEMVDIPKVNIKLVVYGF